MGKIKELLASDYEGTEKNELTEDEVEHYRRLTVLHDIKEIKEKMAEIDELLNELKSLL